MKAISLKQPWATWIQRGAKTIETRTWSTKYRGPLLICASKRPAMAVGLDEELHKFPTGCALCVAMLVECRPMTSADEDAALCDCEPGRWAWLLDRIKAIPPFPVKGQLGIYDVEIPEPLHGKLEALGYV